MGIAKMATAEMYNLSLFGNSCQVIWDSYNSSGADQIGSLSLLRTEQEHGKYFSISLEGIYSQKSVLAFHLCEGCLAVLRLGSVKNAIVLRGKYPFLARGRSILYRRRLFPWR